ncbi:MAG TPA: TIGR03435 family protein [Terracidiphilus sp.]|nr:TIGR03435 family protein [Terracidiphilus sp.]
MVFTKRISFRENVFLIVSAVVLTGSTAVCTNLCTAQAIVPQDSPSKKLPEFEVASIHPSKQDGTSWECLPGGRIKGVQTLGGLISLAYINEVRIDHIVNLPKWGRSDLYAISALPPESSESAKIQYRTVYPSKEQQQMLQSLLIERFHLKFHRESTNEQAYLLFVRRKPDVMRLQPPKDEHMTPYVSLHINNAATGSVSFDVLNSTMSVFARQLGRFTKMNFIDRTGLTGSYDLQVPFYYREKSGDEPASDVGASVLAGLREFGFDVKSAKAPIERIVIDHVDKPSEN